MAGEERVIRPVTATYRLQFNSGFTFADAKAIVPYLSSLGVSHIYASPIFRARPGSTHCYDVVDHNEVSAELGGREELEALVAVAHEHGLGWIQDVVPNHMAYSPDNPLLVDLFENGERSRHRDFFDIEWHAPSQSMEGRVIAPFLGDLYGEVLNRGELTLQYGEDGFAIRYYDMSFPLRVETYRDVIAPRIGELEERLGRDHPEMLKLLGVLYTLESLQGEADPATRWDKVGFVKRLLWELHRGSREVRAYLTRSVDHFNGTPGEPDTFTPLNELHWKQVYRLAYWKVASEEINYRRFFSINDLICLRVERQEVFDHTHGLLFDLVDAGIIDGLRIDHIDGLYQPGEYLARLRERLGDRPIYVEKILHPDEELPGHWPVEGTTGYDALNLVNGLFIDRSASRRIRSFYRSFTGVRDEYQAALHDRKRQILNAQMHGDLDNLTRYMRRVVGDDRHGIDITAPSLRRALGEVMVHLPVYRTYVTDRINRDKDVGYVKSALSVARGKLPHHGYELDYIESFLLLTYANRASEESGYRPGDVVLRFQQFTGPLMAKGLEDTLMYGYLPLLSTNEVGGSPDILGITARSFHNAMRRLAGTHPLSLTASSTHDTKRGEDTRLRINLVSRHFDEWSKAVRAWRTLNRPLRGRVGGGAAPDANDEYLIYQTLLGILPASGRADESTQSRMREYVTKALREAKRRTSWSSPDEAYEDAAMSFLEGAVEQLRGTKKDSDSFAGSFRTFFRAIQPSFEADVVAQQVVRLSMPGVPDIYRGAELLDLTLVDPDNRRPVDWDKRVAMLERLSRRVTAALRPVGADDLAGARGPAVPGVAADPSRDRQPAGPPGPAPLDPAKLPPDQRKLAVMHLMLLLRRRRPELFRAGAYVPLNIAGARPEAVIAFARTRGDDALVVVASRRGALSGELSLPLPYELAHGSYVDLLSGSRVSARESELLVGDRLAAFPALLLWRVPE